ncbi:alpha/beta hydrolase [Micrococcaceae bacterium Sec5.1]
MAEAKSVVSSPLDRAKAMLQHALPAEGGGTLDDRREGYEAVLAQLPIPDDVSIIDATYGGIDGYWVHADGASNGRIGVMLHGGGYIIGSAMGYRAYAAEVSRETDARVFVAEYRLAPEHPFPAALEDARNVLAAAIDEVGPQSVFAIGDSAGGGLVISSLLDLHRAGATLPACIVLVSPLVDLTVTNSSYEERAHSDPIVSRKGIQRAAGLYLDGRGPEEALAAFPMLADLGWLPPCLLLVGGAEVLLDDSRNLAEKLKREGAHVEYREYDGMVHVWTLFSSFLPEGQEALEEIGEFVSTTIPGNRRRN